MRPGGLSETLCAQRMGFKTFYFEGLFVKDTDARLRRASTLVLSLVAIGGAVLSYSTLYHAAVPTFGAYLAAPFPLLTDALILGSTLRFIIGARQGQARNGWRVTSHAAVIGTVTLNAMASPSLVAVPWHIAAPLAWSVLVELSGRDVLGEYQASVRSVARSERIPARLWVAAPVASVRTALLMARLGERSAVAARVSIAVHDASRQALRMALPDDRRTRAVIRRQLRSGVLRPERVVSAIGWTSGEAVSADAVLRTVLTDVMGSPSVYSEPVVKRSVKHSAAPVKRRVAQGARLTLLPSDQSGDGPWPDKRRAVLDAINATDGTPKAVIEWLSLRNVSVSKRYVHTVKREAG